MTETPPPAKDASADEIEADIAATRERLAESVDALADKVNVKARAQEKAEQTKQQAREKLDQAKAKGQDLFGQSKAKGQVLIGRARQSSRSLQLAAVSVPVLIVLLIIRSVRRHRS
jgi:selenocysteine lyase/cysteine desulfurase